MEAQRLWNWLTTTYTTLTNSVMDDAVQSLLGTATSTKASLVERPRRHLTRDERLTDPVMRCVLFLLEAIKKVMRVGSQGP